MIDVIMWTVFTAIIIAALIVGVHVTVRDFRRDKNRTSPPTSPPPGWYPVENGHRWWDGKAWTHFTHEG